ncbi:MAG: hypothetical protein QF473_19210, partial [Planctomycetota bacterium]|nr:hypothetical protein [Planctomycetota bacterium]
VQRETQTLASITFGEYFRRYRKLAGLTGTAKRQASHFREGYNLDVATVPSRRPENRVDFEDRVYARAEAKYEAVVQEVLRYSRDLGRPVLVGTKTVEQSEKISEKLTQHAIEHQTLNARQENTSREAEIIQAAGHQRLPEKGAGRKVGTVTIATNMAGRGTDIRLGPGVVHAECHVPSVEKLATLGIAQEPPFHSGATKCCIHCLEYDEATQCAHCFKPKIDPNFPERGRTVCCEEPPCGLHVAGVERHESRRIDDQLRARAGRQGDPGSSRFFLSLDDRMMKLARKELTDIDESTISSDQGTEDRRISEAIEIAQRKLEQHNFEIMLRAEAAAKSSSLPIST